MSTYLDTRDRERKTIVSYPNGFPVIAARATTESEPAYIIPTGEAEVVRTYLKYSGTVTTCDLTLCEYIDDVWYDGPSVTDALTGSNEYRDWDVEPGTLVGFKVSAITGGGTVAVRARGITDGTA